MASDSEGDPILTDRRIAILGLVVAIIFGIAGVAAAYYFYLKSIQERVPTFLLDSGVTVIVLSDESSDIVISYKGQTIKQRNVLAFRIYFWNHGNLAIRRTDILTPIQCSIDPNSDILEARLLKVSRDVTNLQVNKNDTHSNVVNINFDILEENDGGTIQMIYTLEISGQNQLAKILLLERLL
jgi:hypothetical protein